MRRVARIARVAAVVTSLLLAGTAAAEPPVAADADERLRVVVQLPDRPPYVGARVPITLEIWIEASLQENLYSLSVSAPVFGLGESFRYVQDPSREPPRPGDLDVGVETDSGTVRLRGVVTPALAEGRPFAVITLTRTLVPLRSGSFALEPARVIVREQGPRGQVDPSGVREHRADDEARVLEVRPLPTASAPPSFAGAVGRGFTLEVTADRTVVRAGDPVELGLTLRGEGNLESAGLPPLDAAGLAASAFQAPAAPPTGRLEGEAKHFTAVVRVLDERVHEIPALAYSWFDPSQGEWATTHSRPIALSVAGAERLGAGEVERAEPEPGAAELEFEPAPPPGAPAASAPDLAIEADPGRLLRDPRAQPTARLLPAALYAGGCLLVALALLDRRRRAVDPARRERRARISAERRQLDAALRLPAERAAGEVAGALRRMVAVAPEASSPALDAFLGECDVLSFRPAERSDASPARADAAGLDEAFRERARALASEIARHAS